MAYFPKRYYKHFFFACEQGKVPEKKQTQEEEADTIASVRLAYQDLSIKAKREEEKLKHLDPAKAKQMERLGMGFNLRGYVSYVFR